MALWMVLAAAPLAAGLGYWRLASGKRRPSVPAETVRTATVRAANLERTIRISGTTATERFVSLTVPRMPGTRTYGHGHSEFRMILQKIVLSGARVRKGDIVAEFDPQYMLLRLDDYRALVADHERYLEKLKAQLDVRRKAYEQRIEVARGRMDKARLDLKTAPVRSAIQTERFKLNLGEARAQHQELVKDLKLVDVSERSAIRRSELDLRVTRLELRRAERNVERMVVRAPMDGLAVVRTIPRSGENVEIGVGDQLQPGHQFMQLVDPRWMVLEAWVNQVDAEQMRPGLKARVRLDAFAGLELPGRIVAIGAIARGGSVRASFLKQIPVRLKLEKPDARVLPNFSGSADVILEAEARAAVVPREAVFSNGPGRPVAFVRGAAGWEKRPLELGLGNHVAVAVRTGLRESEVVALARPE